MPTCNWSDVLVQIEREHAFKKSSMQYKSISLSVARKFLKDNGQQEADEVPIEFVHKLERAVEVDFELQDNPQLVLGDTADSAYRTRIRAILRAYRTVTGAEFQEILHQLLRQSDRTENEIATAAGISPGSLQKLKRNLDLASFDEKAVLTLDKVLAASGKLIAAFSAIVMSKQRPSQIVLKLAGQITFGADLRQRREKALLSLSELADKVALPRMTLSAWERGIGLPSLERRRMVEKLDHELKCDGKLVLTWLDMKPAKQNLAGRPYRLPFARWPERLKRQWQRLEDFETKNSLQLDRKRCEPWSPATVKIVLRFIEFVMGSILLQTGMRAEELSLFLLCEWRFIKGWLDFRRERTGNAFYSHSQEQIIALYSSWLCEYFPPLWQEAIADPFWTNKLPNTVSLEIDLAPGVGITRTQEFVLANDKERWAAVVGEAHRKACKFAANEKIVKGSYTKRVQPFLDSKSTIKEIGTILSEAIADLPAKLRGKGIAVHCRRLAECALLIVRAFRKGTVERLRYEHVLMVGGGVGLDCPAEIMKNREPVKGPLPDVPWLHKIIRRYRNEARPLLIGSREDTGLFFVTKRGGSVRVQAVYNDALIVLGVNPHAVRYVVATDGHRQGLSDDELAELLGHDPKMTREIYRKIDAEDRNAKANRTAADLFGANGDRS
jgi:transcriptional regulator with XRE-family HTH domain/integrase